MANAALHWVRAGAPLDDAPTAAVQAEAAGAHYIMILHVQVAINPG